MMNRFKSDRQRKAAFANMSRFSKGRVPNIGETVYVHGDESVGIFPVNGKVVGVHKNSVDAEFKSGNGVVVEELGLEEFDDEVDMKAKQDFETSLYIDWLNEQPTKKLREMAADVSMSGGVDKVINSVLANRLMNGGRTKFSQVTQEQIDSYMQRHMLKSVPDPQFVADEDEEDRLRGIGAKTVYITPPDTAAQFTEYEIAKMRELDRTRRRGAPEERANFAESPVVREAIPGGYASGMSEDMFCPIQVAKGIEVEKEHVIKFTDKGNVKKFTDSDLRKAKEIVCDHLCEMPNYYDRLESMEEQAKADGDFIDVVALRKEAANDKMGPQPSCGANC